MIKNIFITLLFASSFAVQAMTLARRMTTRLINAPVRQRLLVLSPSLLKKFNSTKPATGLHDILNHTRELCKSIEENQLLKSRIASLEIKSAIGSGALVVVHSIMPYAIGDTFIEGLGYTGISFLLSFGILNHFFKKRDDLIKTTDVNQVRINGSYGHLIHNVSLTPKSNNLVKLNWKYKDIEGLIERLKNFEQSVVKAIDQDK